MKQGLNPRRSRGRGNPRGRHPGGGGNRNHQFDSNGPEGRIRGSASQILDRYLALARDAQSAGDTVAAENLFQHAEHYFRVINVNGGNNNQQGRPRTPDSDDGRDDRDQPDYEDSDGRFGAGGDGWRQQRGRDERPQGRGEERPRQWTGDPQRQREAAVPAARADARQAEPPKTAAENSGEGPREEPTSGEPRATDEMSDHRPAFLRRRAPQRRQEAGEQRPAGESPDDGLPRQDAAPAPSETAAEAAEPASDEKPKPRTRRRRAVADGEATAAPRRRATSKRQAEGASEESAEVEGKDLETSA